MATGDTKIGGVSGGGIVVKYTLVFAGSKVISISNPYSPVEIDTGIIGQAFYNIYNYLFVQTPNGGIFTLSLPTFDTMAYYSKSFWGICILPLCILRFAYPQLDKDTKRNILCKTYDVSGRVINKFGRGVYFRVCGGSVQKVLNIH